MWVLPKQEGALTWPLWKIHKQNDYFTIVKSQATFLAVFPYRLLLNGNPQILIAVGKDSREIAAHWEYVENNFVPSIAQQDDRVEWIVAQVKSQISKQECARRERLAQIEHDLENVDIDAKYKSMAVNKCDDADNEEFNKAFGMASNERLIGAYMSTLMWKLPRTGTLYISIHYTCFTSPVMSDNLIVHFCNVHELSKGNYGYGLPASIKLVTKTNNAYEFAVPFKRDEVYEVLEQLWRHAMRTVQQSVTASKLERELNDTHTALLNTDEQEIQKKMERYRLEQAEHRRKESQVRAFLELFHYPNDETLLQHWHNVELISQGSEAHIARDLRGDLYLSQHYVSFATLQPHDESRGIRENFARVSVPLCDVYKVRRSHDEDEAEYADLGHFDVIPEKINLYLHVPSPHSRRAHHKFTFTVPERDKVLEAIRTQLQLFIDASLPNKESVKEKQSGSRDSRSGTDKSKSRDKRKSRDQSSSSTESPPLIRLPWLEYTEHVTRSYRISSDMLREVKYFSSEYRDKEEQQLMHWRHWLRSAGKQLADEESTEKGFRRRSVTPRSSPVLSYALIITDQLRQLVRQGVPNELRGYIWLKTSGAQWSMLARGAGYYRTLLETHRMDNSQALEEIDKDVHRSFPEHEYFQREEGQAALRHVLAAYSWHNPAVGYCQSMNIITALLLLFVSEEEALHMLIALVERVPDYYVKEMIGSVVDLHVFDQLVHQHLPKIAAHLQRFGLDVQLIALPWFLCLFIGYVPLEVVLRILDVFFLEGPIVLFQLGLALLKVKEREILTKRDSIEMIELFKSSAIDANHVLQLAFSEELSLDSEKIAELKNYHKFRALHELEKQTKHSDLRHLAQDSKIRFDRAQLEQYWEEFREEAYLEAADFRIRLEQFTRLLARHVPWWRHAEYVPVLFNMFDKSKHGALTFTDYIRGINGVVHGEVELKCAVAFQLVDKEHANKIGAEQCVQGCELAYRMCQHELVAKREQSPRPERKENKWILLDWKNKQTEEPFKLPFTEQHVTAAFAQVSGGASTIDLAQFVKLFVPLNTVLPLPAPGAAASTSSSANKKTFMTLIKFN
jgi:Ca2+-binding EF-hand superfamily protein